MNMLNIRINLALVWIPINWVFSWKGFYLKKYHTYLKNYELDYFFSKL